MNALRLMLGTLTVLRVPPPTSVDRGTAGAAMLLAPLGGLVLAVPLVLLTALDASSLLVAALTVGALALLTRALHLDGLADTADGLGSGHPGAEALEVMRRSDIGPFGVVTLLLVLLVQVTALASLVAIGFGPAAVLAALLVSRGVLPRAVHRPPSRRPGPTGWGRRSPRACRAVRPPSRWRAWWWSPLSEPRGLPSWRRRAGSRRPRPTSAGSPSPVRGTTAGRSGTGGAARSVWPSAATMLVGGLLAVAAAVLLARRCVRRFGGVTGDVYGACVELAFTTMLVVPALLLP